jgi:hypothetical protein
MIRQNPNFPTETTELARELGVLWRELATELKGMMKIKSIQQGTIALSGATATATLSPAVDVNKAVLMNLGSYLVNSSEKYDGAMLELTNSTTVTARKSGTGDAVSVRYQVVEYEF